MNSKNIDIFVDDSPTDDPPSLVLELMTDDFDIFQRDVMSYSQVMSQMTLDPSADTSGT
jgi:hypothetical protein